MEMDGKGGREGRKEGGLWGEPRVPPNFYQIYLYRKYN